MLRLTKLADYGIVLLIYFAREARGTVLAARDLAARSRLPPPMVSRILKALVGGGVLESHRGVKGGYSMKRSADEVTVAAIVTALEGPIGVTVCTEADSEDCEQEPWCPAQARWQLINQAIHGALSGVSLAEMASPLPERADRNLVEIQVSAAAPASGR